MYLLILSHACVSHMCGYVRVLILCLLNVRNVVPCIILLNSNVWFHIYFTHFCLYIISRGNF